MLFLRLSILYISMQIGNLIYYLISNSETAIQAVSANALFSFITLLAVYVSFKLIPLDD